LTQSFKSNRLEHTTLTTRRTWPVIWTPPFQDAEAELYESASMVAIVVVIIIIFQE